MKLLQGRIRDYAWGSLNAIPGLFGFGAAEQPVAELWMGAHPSAPSFLAEDCTLGVYAPDVESGIDSRLTLLDAIQQSPEEMLGSDVVTRYGPHLPFLLKVIAPARPLSLQVHPSLTQAHEGFAREDAAGMDRACPERSYPDANHKPEMAYAITRFEAIVGFRSPRRILSVLAGLDTALTDAIYRCINNAPNAEGVRSAFAALLAQETRPLAQAVGDVVAAVVRRAEAGGSPSPRADAIVRKLATYYPGDPGVVASLLLNPVTLQPGEALFTPAGTVHAYLEGLAVEVMASSDNVLRAGLTTKHIDVPELLNVISTVAAPPIRIAPERISAVQSTFYVPVDDFELSVIELRDAQKKESVRGYGPRIILCLRGAVEMWARDRRIVVNKGQAVFVEAADGPITVRGAGLLVQADAP